MIGWHYQIKNYMQEEDDLEKVGKDNENWIWLSCLTLSKSLIKLSIDSANLRFPISTNCTLSKWKSSRSREPFERVQSLSGQIKVKHDWPHFVFKISLTSLIDIIYTRLTDQLKSRGRIPQTKMLMEPECLWIFRFKSTYNFYDTICDNLQANLDSNCFYHVKQLLFKANNSKIMRMP